MSVYTVHVTPLDAEGIEARFIREGFAGAALVFGPLWLIYYGLWRALLGWAIAIGLLAGISTLLHISGDTRLLLAELLSLYIGFEGNTLRRTASERSNWPMVDVVTGRRLEEAERDFFSRWHRVPLAVASSVKRPAGSLEILGLFPQGGA